MRRFIYDGVANGIINMSREESAHMLRVLRMKVQDEFLVVDSEGSECICRVTGVENGIVSANVLNKKECAGDPKIKITLYQACLKSDKLEFVLQKAVELGVSEFVPFISGRCVKIPDDKGKQKMLERMEKISAGAIKQCGRAVLPKISKAICFNELLNRLAKHELVIFAYEEETNSLRDAITLSNDIALVIGPEGGFKPEEADDIINIGAKSVSLGKRILKAETAALALTSIVAYETGC